MQKILFLAALLLLPHYYAWSTTFGAFSLIRQVENAPYIIRGKIASTWTRAEPQSNRPYTYWSLEIAEVLAGSDLGASVVVRQPGGEIGGLGYRVPGAASFKAGDDVIVFARDTNEDAKEVLGLASGKYEVRRDGQGEYLENGLGVVLRGAEGKRLNTKDLSDLVRRINSRSLQPGDELIRIDPSEALHAHRHDSPLPVTDQPPTGAAAAETAAQTPPNPSASPQKTVGATEVSADRYLASRGEGAWLGIVAAVIFFAASLGVFLLLRSSGKKKP